MLQAIRCQIGINGLITATPDDVDPQLFDQLSIGHLEVDEMNANTTGICKCLSGISFFFSTASCFPLSPRPGLPCVQQIQTIAVPVQSQRFSNAAIQGSQVPSQHSAPVRRLSSGTTRFRLKFLHLRRKIPSHAGFSFSWALWKNQLRLNGQRSTTMRQRRVRRR